MRITVVVGREWIILEPPPPPPPRPSIWKKIVLGVVASLIAAAIAEGFGYLEISDIVLMMFQSVCT